MWMTGPWACRELAVRRPSFKWDMALVPKGAQRASMLYTVGYGVHAATKHRDAAVALAAFLVSPGILREFSASGRALPSSRKAYETTYLSDAGFSSVQNKTAPLRMLEFARDELVTPQQGQLQSIMGRYVEKVLLGQVQVDEGLAEMRKECNAVLKESAAPGTTP